jgi:protein FAM50
VEYAFRDDPKRVKKRKKTAKATLSFAMDDEGDGDGGDAPSGPAKEDEDEEKRAKRAKFRKNPNVDTSFLPDREREEAERKERERLRLEWLARQEEIKGEDVEITYSYWDGSGHRKSVIVSLVSSFAHKCTCSSSRLHTSRRTITFHSDRTLLWSWTS